MNPQFSHALVKKFFQLASCLALGLAWGLPPTHAAPLNVVATIPDFGSIAEVVGGEHVKVTLLARGTEDTHFVDPRPSFIRMLNRADLLLQGGADLEIGWLPPLLQNARNSRILPGQPGNVSMTQGITLLEVPTTAVDRSQGDIHVFGNPHYWLDPANGILLAEHLATVFAQHDPPHADYFRTNAESFGRKLRSRIVEWEKSAAACKGLRIITYHKTFEYLARWLGIEILNQLEPKPGIEPSPAHVHSLISSAKDQNVRLIVIEPFRPRRTAEVVAEALKAQVLVLPDKTGGVEGADDYFSLFDTIIRKLSETQR